MLGWINHHVGDISDAEDVPDADANIKLFIVEAFG